MFVNKEPGRTSSATAGPSGQATDPISTATLPLPGAYRGCRIMRPAATDPTVATSIFGVTKDLVLMGGPVVDITFSTTAPDTQLHARLWDVAADGSAQGLVTRGTFRSLDAPGDGRRARFQLAPQGYRFPAGHRLRLEITANDAPYFQVSNVPAVVQVASVALTMPLLSTAQAAGLPGGTVTPRASAPARTRGANLPATGAGSTVAWFAVAVVSLAIVLRRLVRRAW
jgi:hypothetical protein